MRGLLLGTLAAYAILHVTMLLGSTLVVNLLGSDAYYGHSESGILPKELYDLLITTNYGGISGTGAGEGFSFFEWALNTPLCKISQLIDAFIVLSILDYPLLTDTNIIPDEGFGNWFRTMLNVMGGTMLLAVVGMALTILFQSNVLNQLLTVGGLASGALAAVLAKLADGVGLIGCSPDATASAILYFVKTSLGA